MYFIHLCCLFLKVFCIINQRENTIHFLHLLRFNCWHVPCCFYKVLIITSLYLTRVRKKHMTLDFGSEERIVSHSKCETKVGPRDPTDGWGMPKLSLSPGDHQQSLSAASSWGSNNLIRRCPRFPGHSPDPRRAPFNGRPKAWGELHLSIRPITDFSGTRDGHMLGISCVEFSATKLCSVSQSEITENQRGSSRDWVRFCFGCSWLGVQWESPSCENETHSWVKLYTSAAI